jgi:hypothetical protein
MLPPEAANALSGSETTTTDPIFSVIAAYRQALADRLAYGREEEEDESRGDELMEREFALHHELLTTKPMTVGGVAALLDVLSNYPYDDKGVDCAETVIEMGFTLDRGNCGGFFSKYGTDPERTANALKAAAQTLRNMCG